MLFQVSITPQEDLAGLHVAKDPSEQQVGSNFVFILLSTCIISKNDKNCVFLNL